MTNFYQLEQEIIDLSAGLEQVQKQLSKLSHVKEESTNRSWPVCRNTKGERMSRKCHP